MNINLTLLGQFAVVSMVMCSIALGMMASRRRLNKWVWILAGFIPLLNVVAVFFIALKPTSNE